MLDQDIYILQSKKKASIIIDNSLVKHTGMRSWLFHFNGYYLFRFADLRGESLSSDVALIMEFCGLRLSLQQGFPGAYIEGFPPIHRPLLPTFGNEGGCSIRGSIPLPYLLLLPRLVSWLWLWVRRLCLSSRLFLFLNCKSMINEIDQKLK